MVLVQFAVEMAKDHSCVAECRWNGAEREIGRHRCVVEKDGLPVKGDGPQLEGGKEGTQFKGSGLE
jgi:hypothetical protein